MRRSHPFGRWPTSNWQICARMVRSRIVLRVTKSMKEIMDNSADRNQEPPTLARSCSSMALPTPRYRNAARYGSSTACTTAFFPNACVRINCQAPRWGLLMRLYIEEVSGNMSGLSPSQLSHYQHVSKNTVSALLRGLEEQGLIARQARPKRPPVVHHSPHRPRTYADP